MTALAPTRFAAIDFSRDIERLTRDFVGREWIFRELDNWLSCGAERFFILSGEPGVGKSAIAARLTQIRNDIAAYHFCIAGRNSTVTPGIALRSWAAQLSEHLPNYGVALANSIDPIHLSLNVKIDVHRMTGGEITGIVIEHLHANDPEDELDILLRAPLTQLPAPSEPLLILVDSLDEAVTIKTDVNLVTLLAKVDDLPSWVRFVCTTRAERRVLRYFDKFNPYLLAAESQINLDDVRQYIANRVGNDRLRGQLDAAKVEPQSIVNQITQLSSGNFLYTQILLNDIEAGRQPLDNLAALPRSLDETYHQFLARFSVEAWEERYQPLLQVFGVAREPLTEKQLANFTGIQQGKVRQTIGVLQQFLDRGGDGRETYTLFHQSLRDYLLDGERNQDFWCPAEDGHQNIAGFYMQNYHDRWHAGDLYGLRHLPAHLVGAHQLEALRDLLFDFNWLQARLTASDVATLIADYDWLPADATLRLVQSSIRLAAFMLARDKTQLAAQLIGRLLASNAPEISVLLDQAKQWKATPWLRPLIPSLTPPGALLWDLVQAHDGTARAVALTSDGKRAISASNDGTLKVWDLVNWKELCTLPGQSGAFSAVAITSDGRRAISGSSEGTLNIWDLEQAKESCRLPGHSQRITAVAITPDGRRAISASFAHDLKVWDPVQCRELHSLQEQHSTVTSLALTAVGRRAVSASEDGTIIVWDVDNGRDLHTLPAHAGYNHSAVDPYPLLVTDDGRQVIIPAADRSLKVWDIERGTEVRTLPSRFEPGTVRAVTADGRRAILADPSPYGSHDYTLKVWDLEKGMQLRTLRGHTALTSAVAMTPDGRRAISADLDHNLKVWDLAIESIAEIDRNLIGAARVVALSPDGQRALAAFGAEIKLWDLNSWREPRTLRAHQGQVLEIAITPDGQQAVSASHDNALVVWDLQSGLALRVVAGDSAKHFMIAATADRRKFICTLANKTLNLWGVKSGIEPLRLRGFATAATAIAMTPDGRRAIFGANGNTLKVWNMKSKTKLHTLRGHQRPVTRVLISLEGQRALSASEDGQLIVWNLESREMLHRLSGHITPVTAMAMTPDGRRAISVGHPTRIKYSPQAEHVRTIKVWDLDNGAELPALIGHASTVYNVAITSDGQRVISTSEDSRLKVWDLNSGKVITSYSAESPLASLDITPDGFTIAAIDRSGQMHVLRLEGFQIAAVGSEQ